MSVTSQHFFGQANLRTLLAVKAVDVLRGAWGFGSFCDCIWGALRIRRGPGGSVYKPMCPLAVATANGLRSTPLLCGNEGAVAWPGVADITVSLKNSTRPLMCVSVWEWTIFVGSRGWKWACNTLRPITASLHTHTSGHAGNLLPLQKYPWRWLGH